MGALETLRATEEPTGGWNCRPLAAAAWSWGPKAGASCPEHPWVPPPGQASVVSYEGMLLIVRRGLESVTYTSLCLPDDIRHRGLSHLPNYHYRDDGLKLWEAIARWDQGVGDSWRRSHGCAVTSRSHPPLTPPHRSFVGGIVDFYYGEDAAASGDAELQAWVMDIFTNGFLGRTSSGATAVGATGCPQGWGWGWGHARTGP